MEFGWMHQSPFGNNKQGGIPVVVACQGQYAFGLLECVVLTTHFGTHYDVRLNVQVKAEGKLIMNAGVTYPFTSMDIFDKLVGARPTGRAWASRLMEIRHEQEQTH
jgi:hypothetical protein